jgi:hypothetical protein
MKRHEFIMGLGGATVWSVLVQAQQSGASRWLVFLWLSVNQAEEAP